MNDGQTHNIPSLRFQPPPNEQLRFALWVDGGGFHQYRSVGSAKGAYYHKAWRGGEARILELIDGEWYTLYHIPANTSRDKLPWIQQVEANRYYGSYRVSKAVPMTREQYAEFRVAVERERVARHHITMPRPFQPLSK